jgi:glycerophosphoryl diester phosphodiesterase
MIYAHRGASFELPDNSLEAFALALELGADAIETDAHMTRDGHIVLAHDPTGAATSGDPRAISDLTLGDLRSWNIGSRFHARREGAFRRDRVYRMPTLEEALEAHRRVIFNVDAKQTDPDMTPALVRAIRRMGAEDRVRIASFSERNLARVRAMGYAGETGLAPSEIARIVFLPQAALRWWRVAGHAAQIPRRAYGIVFAKQSTIDRFHVLGLRVDFWTIDDPTEAQRLLGMGADGIMTDDPRTLCAT